MHDIVFLSVANKGHLFTFFRLRSEGESGDKGRDVRENDIPEELQRARCRFRVCSRWKVHPSGERWKKGNYRRSDVLYQPHRPYI